MSPTVAIILGLFVLLLVGGVRAVRSYDRICKEDERRWERGREWEVRPAFDFKLHRPRAEYVAPMSKTRIGIREKS